MNSREVHYLYACRPKHRIHSAFASALSTLSTNFTSEMRSTNDTRNQQPVANIDRSRVVGLGLPPSSGLASRSSRKAWSCPLRLLLSSPTVQPSMRVVRRTLPLLSSLLIVRLPASVLQAQCLVVSASHGGQKA